MQSEAAIMQRFLGVCLNFSGSACSEISHPSPYMVSLVFQAEALAEGVANRWRAPSIVFGTPSTQYIDTYPASYSSIVLLRAFATCSPARRSNRHGAWVAPARHASSATPMGDVGCVMLHRLLNDQNLTDRHSNGQSSSASCCWSEQRTSGAEISAAIKGSTLANLVSFDILPSLLS